MNMSKLVTVLIVFLLISCGNDKSQKEVEMNNKDEVSAIKKEDLSKLDFIDFILDRKSKNKIEDWIKYNELEEKINELKEADLSYFKSDKKVVKTLVMELVETTPENINTDGIKARLLVLQNMYLKLSSSANLSTSTKKELKKDIKDLLEAFSNLNYQINKKFEKDAQRIIKP